MSGADTREQARLLLSAACEPLRICYPKLPPNDDLSRTATKVRLAALRDLIRHLGPLEVPDVPVSIDREIVRESLRAASRHLAAGHKGHWSQCAEEECQALHGRLLVSEKDGGAA